MSPAAPHPTETAVVVLVPEAEPLVGTHRARLDPAASWGVPAHVTVLYPFVPPDAVDGGVLERLAAAVATVDAFEARLTGLRWFREDVVYLAPEPVGRFRALTTAVHAAFPEHPPYGGAHEDVVPHLTVGTSGAAGAVADLRAAEAAITADPVQGVEHRVTEVVLMAGTQAPGAWHVVAALPLGTG